MISHIRVFKVCLLATVRILRKVLHIRGGGDYLNRSKMKEDASSRGGRRIFVSCMVHPKEEEEEEEGGGEEEKEQEQEEQEEEEDRIETKKGA